MKKHLKTLAAIAIILSSFTLNSPVKILAEEQNDFNIEERFVVSTENDVERIEKSINIMIDTPLASDKIKERIEEYVSSEYEEFYNVNNPLT